MLKKLTIMYALLFVFSCTASNKNGEQSEQAKACKKLSDKGNSEIGASVQPPALIPVSTHKKPLSPSILFKDADIIGGLNLRAIGKLGILNMLQDIFREGKMVVNAMGVFNLKPGEGLEHILFAVKFSSEFPKIDKSQVFITGNFDAENILDRIYSMSTSFPNLKLPPMEKAGKSLIISFGNKKYTISPYSKDSLLITDIKGKPETIANNGIFKASSKNIIPGTSLWLLSLRSFGKVKGAPKLVDKFLSKIDLITGYINNDSVKNSELQIRARCKTVYDAKQLKELIRLGLSQMAAKIGSSFRKKLNLSGNTEVETVVTRGPLIRILFKLEPKQTSDFVLWIKKQLIRKQLIRNSY